MLEEFGIGRYAFRPVWQKPETEVAWTPRIEIVLEHNELMVRAELPGVEPKDVTVEVKDERLILKGTRHKAFKRRRRNTSRQSDCTESFTARSRCRKGRSQRRQRQSS